MHSTNVVAFAPDIYGLMGLCVLIKVAERPAAPCWAHLGLIEEGFVWGLRRMLSVRVGLVKRRTEIEFSRKLQKRNFDILESSNNSPLPNKYLTRSSTTTSHILQSHREMIFADWKLPSAPAHCAVPEAVLFANILFE